MMIAPGHVKDGAVVLDNGLRLPEGQQVTVFAPGAAAAIPQPHSLLNVAPVSLGGILNPRNTDDDLLGEMLEGRS